MFACSTEEGVAGAVCVCARVLAMAGSRDLATTASNFASSFFRWEARAILPQTVARPDVPSPEEAERRGRGADMVGVNNQR